MGCFEFNGISVEAEVGMFWEISEALRADAMLLQRMISVLSLWTLLVTSRIFGVVERTKEMLAWVWYG